MDWHPGQIMLRKEGGVYKQNPQILMMPTKGSFITHQESKKLTRFIQEHGLEEDQRPYVANKKVKPYKWKPKKAKRGGE
jgi:hypothetical protein